ncbi:unnamed protein product [Diamesa tonsa]
MYWQNSKFRSDFAEKIQVVIRSSRMICNFTAIEIENSIFRACQHDSDVYFQQIYDLTVYIKKQKNNEYLTQDVINNPTEALRKFIDNARNLVAEPGVSKVAQTRTLTVAQSRVTSTAQTRTSSSAQTRVSSTTAQTRVLLPSQARIFQLPQTRVASASQPQKISRTERRILTSAELRLLTLAETLGSTSAEPRVSSTTAQTRVLPPTQAHIFPLPQTRVSSAEPRSNSALLDPVLSDREHYNLLKAQLRSNLAYYQESLGAVMRSKEQIGVPNLRTNPELTDQYLNSVFEYANLDVKLKTKLEDRSCSSVCYKEFKKVGRLLRKSTSTDSNCKMCLNRSSIAVPANAVLYSCGHNFLCHGCAMSYWNKGKSCGCEGCLVNCKVVCPICRVVIKDVIKSYSPI